MVTSLTISRPLWTVGYSTFAAFVLFVRILLPVEVRKWLKGHEGSATLRF